MQDANCIFCKILKGELPGYFIYRDEQVAAFLDIHPINPGHVLVIPTNHHQWFNDIPPEVVGRIFQVAQEINKALREAPLKIEATNLFLSDGTAAGQEVLHSHLHITPRFHGDHQKLGFARIDSEAAKAKNLDMVAQALRKRLPEILV